MPPPNFLPTGSVPKTQSYALGLSNTTNFMNTNKSNPTGSVPVNPIASAASSLLSQLTAATNVTRTFILDTLFYHSIPVLSSLSLSLNPSLN